MAHDLKIDDKGVAQFAFNQKYGDPWHKLGVGVDGNMTIQQALETARADFFVKPMPVYADDGLDTLVEVEGKIATVATYPDDRAPHALGVHGEGYTIVQNTEALQVAYDIVGASDNDAYLDTLGVLGNGGQLFAYLRLEDLIIDPIGINDEIERGLVIWWSHDGSIAMTYLFSATRVVCRNTLNFALHGAKTVFRAKHTASVEARLSQAQQVLGVSTSWANNFKKKSEELLAVSYSQDRFERVLNSVFPEPNNATDRQKTNTQAVHTQIRGTFANERNSKNFGSNGWTMYNAIVEYLDHGREAGESERLKATMTPASWVQKKKERAAEAVLALP